MESAYYQIRNGHYDLTHTNRIIWNVWYAPRPTWVLIPMHGELVDLYRRQFEVNNGFTKEPWNDLKWDSESAKVKNAFDFEYWSDPIFLNGDYPDAVKKILNDLNIHLPRFTPDEIEANSGAADFLGVNHYMNRVSMNSISYVTLFVSRSISWIVFVNSALKGLHW